MSDNEVPRGHSATPTEQRSSEQRLVFALRKAEGGSLSLKQTPTFSGGRKLSAMSGHRPSDEKQGKYLGWRGSDGRTSGGGRVKKYLHAIRETSLSPNLSNELQLQEVEKMSGASVHFDCDPSPVPGMKIVVIQGVPSQIEVAVKLISEMTATVETLSAQAQTFWLQWVEAAFPDLDSRVYFLPPVYVNRVPKTRQTVAGQDVLVLQSAPGQAGQSSQLAMIPHATQPPLVMDSDIRDDTTLQRVLVCLKKISKKNKEIMVGMSQLRFGQYLDEPCYSAAAAYLPLPKNLPNSTSKDRQGDFDVLLIHRRYSFVVCEVKSVGLNAKQINLLGEELDITIREKLKEAVQQLDKAEAMLSHLVSDIAPGLRITKTIAVPNLTAHQVQQAISSDSQLIEDLCGCLGTTTDPADITGVCLCCDQLSDPKTPCDVSSHVLRELGHWWQRRVAGAGPDPHMSPEVYKNLIARFCGPATTVSVPCTCPPRVSVKTLGQAVWCTGECYTAVITLFPEQVHLLHTAPPTLFVTGPPGTGKTVVLLLMAMEWLRCGHHVYIVSTWWGSRAVCNMLYHMLQTVNTQQSAGVSRGQPYLMEFNFPRDKDMDKAVNDLSQAAVEESLYVIVDEAGPENTSVWPVDSSGQEQSRSDRSNDFEFFCDKLLTQFPGLHLWAASCFHGHAPAGWQVEYLTRPLRSPPAVVRELQKTWEQNTGNQKKQNQMTYNQKGQNYKMSSQETGDQKADNQRKEDHVTDDQEIDSHDTYNQGTDRQETDSQKTNNQKTQNQETDNQESRSQKASNHQSVYFVQPYSERGFPDHTDGPPVRRLYHRGQGHSGNNPGGCVTCGREVANFLHSLRVGVTVNAVTSTTVATTSSGTPKPCLQWRDILVLYYWRDFTEDSGVMTGLREAGIPVRLMKDDDTKDVATARSDVVWVADGERVRGLERKVVVCLDPRVETVRLHQMSRCTSQLVIVLVDDEPPVSNSSYLTRDAAFLQLNTTDLTKAGLKANSFFDL